MYQQDYILRQIEICCKVIGKYVFRRDIISGEIDYENVVIITDDSLESILQAYINQKRINEGEDLLFEYVNKEPLPHYFNIAMDFYKKVNELTEEELQQCNFSREEILRGIEDMKQIYTNNGK